MKIAFFEIEGWEVPLLKKKFAKDGAELSFFEERLNEDLNIPSYDFDVISVFIGSQINRAVISKFPNLKCVTTRSTGFDHIDLEAVRERRIQIAYVPGYGDNTVAEFVFGLILSISRKLYEAIDRIRETSRFSFDGLRGFDLKGKTIGVIGTGRIGCEVIKIARGFGMNVLAYDAYPKEEAAKSQNFSYASFDDLLGKSDIVTVHVPYNESTHHLINAGNISKMKKGSVLINTSRGGIVETNALIQALKEGILAGAGLDVLEEEGGVKDEEDFILHETGHDLKTILQDHILMKMPNVVVTPHMAFNTKEALERILETDMENIEKFIEGGEAKYMVK